MADYSFLGELSFIW